MRVTRKKLTARNQGFVSMIVALILIVVISLITLGFAFLVRQNQRNNLNRELSTQAFYAAESAVNDATRNLSTIGDVTSCSDVTRVGTPVLNSTNDIRYTCVLINTQPDSLVYDSISDKDSTVIHITTTTPVANLKFSWADPNGSTAFAANAATSTTPPFPLPMQPTYSGAVACGVGCDSAIAAFPNNIGILRTTIIPSSAATSTDSLLNGSQTIYMYPNAATSANTGTSTAFRASGALATEGTIVSGSCFTSNTPRACNASITGINSSDFYVRMKAIYKPVQVYVSATDSGGNVLKLQGAQAVVDATGRAKDVVRRIQVRVPLTPSYYFPEFGIETGNTICKRMSIFPGGAQVISPPAGLGSYNDGDKDEKACQLPGQAQPNFPY